MKQFKDKNYSHYTYQQLDDDTIQCTGPDGEGIESGLVIRGQVRNNRMEPHPTETQEVQVGMTDPVLNEETGEVVTPAEPMMEELPVMVQVEYNPWDELHELVQAGEITIIPIDTEAKQAELAAEVRSKRDLLIASTDWRVLPDYPGTDQEQWKAYRSALRDVTKQHGFPESVQWPEIPVEA